MTKLQKLKTEARRSARLRWHVLGAFRTLEQNRTFIAVCACGQEVVVNLSPWPNEIDIGGEAIALSCPIK